MHYQIPLRLKTAITSLFALFICFGAGSSSERIDYEFNTEEINLGVSLFRLKQVDYDGAFAYSEIVQVSLELASDFVLDAAYPNPFNPSTNISYGVKEAQNVSLTLYNTTGNVVKTLFDGEVQANQMHTAVIDGSDLASGTYLVLLRGEDFVSTRSIILIK